MKWDKNALELRSDKLKDKRVTADILQPILKKVGSPGKLGLMVGAGTFLPSYLIFKLLRLKHPALRAAALGTGAGLVTTGATTVTGKGAVNKGDLWAEQLAPAGKPKYIKDIEQMEKAAIKDASDFFNTNASAFADDYPAWAMPHSTKQNLYGAVNAADFTKGQKALLTSGIQNSPGNLLNISDLASGFEKTVGSVTGGLVPMATRAVEGAILGSAFSGLMGTTPGTKKWITGIASLGDALYGNQLFNLFE